jgi:hypothetical protein
MTVDHTISENPTANENMTSCSIFLGLLLENFGFTTNPKLELKILRN